MPKPDLDHLIIETHTIVTMLKEDYERRLSGLEVEDDVLHKRINETHGRINHQNKIFTSVGLGMNAAWAGALAYFKMKG